MILIKILTILICTICTRGELIIHNNKQKFNNCFNMPEQSVLKPLYDKDHYPEPYKSPGFKLYGVVNEKRFGVTNYKEGSCIYTLQVYVAIKNYI